MDRSLLSVQQLDLLPVSGHERAHVAGASGIVRIGSWLHLVSDDEHHVYSWQLPMLDDAAMSPFSVGDLPPDPVARKALKADVESLLVLRSGSTMLLVGLGSGSTERRRSGFAFRLDDDGGIVAGASAFDLGPVYDLLATDDEPPNVEGAAQVGNAVVLLLRSSTGGNRVARLASDELFAGIATGRIPGDALASVTSCHLGELGGVPLGFTDAASIDDELWFSAAAEDTANAYDDGEVRGSVIGCLDAAGSGVHRSWELDLPGSKVEGITRASADDEPLRLWLVTDQDDETRPSRLLECTIPLG